MADVAKHAGVTKATVSNVLSGKGRVRAGTRERVLKSITELNYTPNLVARSLAKGKTGMIALVVPGIANPFFAEIVEEVEHLVAEQGYNLIFCTTRGEPQRLRSQLQMLANRSIDGLLLAGVADVSDILSVTEQEIPVVLFGWDYEPYPGFLPIVTLDFEYAGRLAAQHLLELGHRQIGVIFEESVLQARLRGFQALLAEADIQLSPGTMQPGGGSFEGGYRAATLLLTHHPRLTAIFATNDLMALGAMDALTQRGLHIPQDVSLLGLDDIALGAYAHPPLSTIAIPKRLYAQEVVNVLLRSLKENIQLSHLLIALRPSLVIRRSTAPPTRVRGEELS